MALLPVLLTLLLQLLTLSSAQQCTSDDPSTCQSTSGPTTSLPADFQDPCRDSNKDCPAWSIMGECRSNPNFMSATCPRSCGLCKPLKLEGVDNVEGAMKEEDGRDVCRDEVLECVDYARDGECLINPDYMRRDNCKYSCWVCVDPGKDRALGVDEKTIAKKILYADMYQGKPQLIRDVTDGSETEDPMTPEAHNAVRSTIASMEEYARNVITSPNVHVKARERCRNEFRMCAEWASRGYCHPAGHPEQAVSDGDATISKAKDVLFMMNMCPLACQTCEEIPSLACAGKRHPHAAPVMEESGGINTYFEGLMAKKNDNKAVFISQPKSSARGGENDSYVVVIPDFITNEEADTLFFLGKITGFTDDSASCRGNTACTAYKLEQDEIYAQIMQRVAGLANTTTDYLEAMKIYSHKSEQTTGLQHNYQLSGVWKPAGPRVVSFQIFLSDHDKGQLGFPHLDWLFVQPKKGTVAVWPNVVNENVLEMDPLTSYEYFGVDGEEMYVANVNVMLHNWTDASYRNCA